MSTLKCQLRGTETSSALFTAVSLALCLSHSRYSTKACVIKELRALELGMLFRDDLLRNGETSFLSTEAQSLEWGNGEGVYNGKAEGEERLCRQ